MAKTRKNASKATSDDLQDIKISEEEQWRLVRESGVLSKVAVNTDAKESKSEPNDGPGALAEEIFDAAIIIMPMTFFLILMEILIHHQYARQPTFREVVQKLLNTLPIMSVFMFYTIRHKHNTHVQVALFLLSLGVAPRMIWLVNRGNWLTNIAQCPQFATIWLYTILQLNLPFAVLSLCLVGTWTWWSGLRLL
ncbi:hypothetical protein SCLCIDRAFT_105377 [Scleroderma citrinum Foug A]|uniref:DUF7719 domain-containing protein n=1 Tax=Scleroderma citrinum Foug A TaxID=1036808 RepID=A0A0C3EKB4_9AGAM|nr:hypothetical protein SCLCIDRAFT_105377 [Scleroderma citrinum Foug A]